MTEDELAAISPRQRAEAMAAAGLVPEPPDPLPPVNEHKCHGCGYRLDPLWVQLGETLHPLCKPPKPDRRRRGGKPRKDDQ